MSKQSVSRRKAFQSRELAAPPLRLPAWTPFQRATMPNQSDAEILRRAVALAPEFQMTVEKAEEVIRDLLLDDVYLNSRYQVNVRRFLADQQPPVLHLSIKRRDKQPVGIEHFRDFQRIKNELVGPECEGIEIYPAEDRLIDTANQYHLWCVQSGAFRFPVGFDDGRHVTGIRPDMFGAVQEPFEKGEPGGPDSGG